MKIKTVTLEGINYLAPVGFKFISDSVADYPPFCGAGEGIGEKAIPEKIGGKPCSHI